MGCIKAKRFLTAFGMTWFSGYRGVGTGGYAAGSYSPTPNGACHSEREDKKLSTKFNDIGWNYLC